MSYTKSMEHPVAVVTGAGPGLGGVIAQELAKRGARLVICDIDPNRLLGTEQAIRAIGGEVLSLQCDVTSSAAVDALFEKVRTHFGTVHVLVNNAAVIPTQPIDLERRNKHYASRTMPLPRASLGFTSAMTDEDWMRYWNVNVHGVFYCTRAALRLMEPQKYGRIVNVASVAGMSSLSMHSPSYSASKGAVIAFTKSVAAEVAGGNILVNALAPGGVHTPDFEALLQSMGEENRNRFWQMIPSGRLGTMEEYAHTVVHLCCDPHYIAGQVISPNGAAVI